MVDAKKRDEGIKQFQKALAYDQAIAKLHEAGVGEEFLKAVDKSPELLKAIKKIGPDIGPGPVADWSCCITVSNPIKPPGSEVINPAKKKEIIK